MAAVTCPKCGAEFDEPARFCRRCGNSLGTGEPSISSSEATTKSFDYPAPQNAPESTRTAPANQWPTAPAYLGPQQMGSDQMTVSPPYPAYPGTDTRGLAQKRSKAPFIILGVMGFVVVMVIAVFALVVSRMSSLGPGPGHERPGLGTNIPPEPPGAGAPGHAGNGGIPDPPPPPPDMGGAPATGRFASLIYPGSTEIMNAQGDHGDGVISLSTQDPTDKVVDWYVARLPHAERVSVPFVGGAVITNDQATVIITPGSPTNIMLTKGKKGK
jgi:hypothetical protein